MIKNSVFEILKGVLISLVCSLTMVLIFAFVLKQFSLSAKVIRPVNTAIKVVVIFLGSFFSIKPPKGFIKGAILGCVATIIQHLLYSLFSGGIELNLSFFIDLFLGIVMGIICGIICSNLKK